MKRRFLYLTLGALSLILAGLLAGTFLANSSLLPRRSWNPDAFGKIQNGMTLRQVETLFGGPAGNYGRHSGGGSMTLEGYLAPPNSREVIWCDDSRRFEIYFDSQDLVVGFHKRAHYEQLPPPHWWHRLLDAVGM